MMFKRARTLMVLSLVASCTALFGVEDREIDPTWLYRNASSVAAKPSDITTHTCHYKALFGAGDRDTSVVVGVARYGEVTVDPNGACASVQYPQEDQVYVVLSGSGNAQYGNDDVPLKAEDYLYIPSTVSHVLKNPSAKPLVAVIMGFRTKGFEPVAAPKGPMKANIEDVPTALVQGHPDSTRYRLLMGDIDSKRDRIAAGRVLTSLFLMEIAPSGTNFPHHHEREEEIYLVLSGRGTMVAGGGMDGVAGRHPAKPGDAYFFRLNATVGYYSAPNVSSRILCVRSWYPGMVKKGMEH